VALFLALAGQAVVAAVSPQRLEPVIGTDQRPVGMSHLIGVPLLFGGIALLVAATLTLGASWRIGIEEGSRPGLVTSGVYRFCRNPIYFAIFVILAGYTLLLPTRLSLALLIGASIGVRQQVLTEEAYLARAYGDAFQAYARNVGRFVPGIGRLRR
jgi:protein-S-isoprenylcysteine O-methyltransferase Ste14